MGRLFELQKLIQQWQEKNFDEVEMWELALGVCEEAGELCHCVLKSERGMNGEEELDLEMRDAIGDVIVFLLGLCELKGWNIEEVVEEAVATVLQREWR